MALEGMPQVGAGINPVRVPPALLQSSNDTCRLEVLKYPLYCPLGNLYLGSNISNSGLRVPRQANEHMTVVGKEGPADFLIVHFLTIAESRYSCIARGLRKAIKCRGSMNSILVVTRVEDFPTAIDGIQVVQAKSYLTDPAFTAEKNLRVYNLCRYYRYQSSGYYVSLLAEARGHRAWPSVSTLQDFRSRSVLKSLSDDLDYLIQKSLKRLHSDEFILSIYFGQNLARQYEELSRALASLFEVPMLRVTFEKIRRGWVIQSARPISLKEIPEGHLEFMKSAAETFFKKKIPIRRSKRNQKYGLAILLDPQEEAPPSDDVAIRRFIRAAESMNLEPETITKEDFQRIPDFDALFIRTTTSVTNATYRFARKASAEGLVVVDDPLSIVRCTNKVYLAELLERNRIPIPQTIVIHRDNVKRIADELGFPVILKQPDSSFSQGVVKVVDPAELKKTLDGFFDESDLVIAQRYTPTDFDWRVGVLDKKALLVCKYYMARGHWQIYNWKAPSGQQSGAWETYTPDGVAPEIVKVAVRAANLIGDGFYGVDLKLTPSGPVVIEINDNPSVESAVEDMILKDKLYESVMEYFLSRIQARKGG